MGNKVRMIRKKLKRLSKVSLLSRPRNIRQMSRHPFAVPFITFGVLLTVSGIVYVAASQTDKLPPTHDAKIVIISHDNEQQIVPSGTATVGELLKKLNIPLNQGDVVEPAKNTRIDQDQFRINIYRAVPIEIVDGTKRTFTFSAAKTPRAIAQQVGTTLYPEDRAQTEPVQNFLKTGAIGEQVIVDRATPVAVDLYGTPVVLRTHATTVEGLMKEKGIKLIKDDRVAPAVGTPLSQTPKVSFIRTGVKTETVREVIAKPTQTINDATLAYGTTAVRQEGTDGEQVVTYQIAITNNVETARTVIQKVVTKQPVTQISVVGTSLSGIKGDMALAGIAPSDYQYADYIIGRESGWRPNARNASGAYGLCQALPGSKMSSAGADWATNPITQLKWCNGYAKGRYGTWAAAYSYWMSHHYW
jgi:resuscitation-promoting factor RpfB